MTIVVIAPDKFKGSLSAVAACRAIEQGVRRVLRDGDLRACPMADGGDGTLDAILARGGERRSMRASAADGCAREMPYGLVHDVHGPIAVLEAASIVGLVDELATRTPVARRSTRGLGEMMRALLDQGVRRFMVGLGGSSTNDGGAGLLRALGLELQDGHGAPVEPTPDGLAGLAAVGASALDARLPHCEITILSDVDNPLCGPRGATAVFGPQKGVQPSEIEALDGVLARFAGRAERATGRSAALQPGAGAAGGLGFALLLLGARLRPGAEVVAEINGLDAALDGADWVITGEGRSDTQTPGGKAPWIVAQRARARSVPVTLLSGSIDRDALPALTPAFAGCFALPDAPMTLEQCVTDAAALLAHRAEQIARLWFSTRS